MQKGFDERQELASLVKEASGQLWNILSDLIELASQKAPTASKQKVGEHALSIILGDEQEFVDVLSRLGQQGDQHYALVYAARLLEAAFMIGASADPSRAQELLLKLDDESQSPRKPRPLGIRAKMITALRSLYTDDPRLRGLSRDEIFRAVEKETGPLGEGKMTSLDRALKDIWPG